MYKRVGSEEVADLTDNLTVMKKKRSRESNNAAVLEADEKGRKKTTLRFEEDPFSLNGDRMRAIKTDQETGKESLVNWIPEYKGDTKQVGKMLLHKYEGKESIVKENFKGLE